MENKPKSKWLEFSKLLVAYFCLLYTVGFIVGIIIIFRDHHPLGEFFTYALSPMVAFGVSNFAKSGVENVHKSPNVTASLNMDFTPQESIMTNEEENG